MEGKKEKETTILSIILRVLNDVWVLSSTCNPLGEEMQKWETCRRGLSQAQK